MKTSNLQKLFWVFFALIVTTTSVYAQGRRNVNRIQDNQNLPCVTQISNLSDQQVTEIEKLEAGHRETMEELRTQRRSTIDAVEKSEIRTEMLKQVQTHQNDVKGLLTADQKAEYEQLQNNGGLYKNQRYAQNNRGRNSAGNYGRQNCVGCRGNGNNVAAGQNGQRGNNCIQRGGNGNRNNGNFRGNQNNRCRFNS
ncbi:hypothetical protein [uncultured Draconibacterium sp.]|uniref:Spy/CpxP family protein refolding chaperone n=1 Tax=uncultured Draconibacterium sp. TaxID=1573823 RepID=UPI0032178C5D